MDKINFAIIGYGSIAKTHALAVYDANIRYDLPYEINLSHIVTRKPINIHLKGVKNVTHIEEVLEDKSIHFIDICTPNDSHFPIVKRAVEYGKHIYCEKPLSSSYSEAVEMTNLVKENKIVNGVALIYRFLPAVRMLKKEIEKKGIGEIIDFKIKTYHKSYLSKKDTWRTKKNSGGGALLDLGVHLIDLIQFTIDDIEEVDHKNRIYFKERNEVDEISSCNFILKNGVTGNLEVSRIFAERQQSNYFVIYGTKGSIKVDLSNPYELELYKYESSSTEIKNAVNEENLLKNYAGVRSSLGFFQNCHTAALINFTNRLDGECKDTQDANFEDALKCQKIIEKIYATKQ
jgi:predicted dehydrogenase